MGKSNNSFIALNIIRMNISKNLSSILKGNAKQQYWNTKAYVQFCWKEF